MPETITLPSWLAVLVVTLATLALINHFLLPALRWFARRTANKVIRDVNKGFKLELPTFQLTRRQVLIDRLVYDPEVLETVTRIAEKRGVMRDGVMSEVVMIAREMVPSFNAYVYFRLGYRIARRLLRSFYRVHAGWVHEAAREKTPPNTSIVFFINHRSNMDYLLVTYLASQRTALSYGAGEWARIWPFRPILRLAGAYILHRNHKSPIYRIVLRRYVQMATAAGVPHAIFSEGELSRNGMVNDPKLGILSYVCRNFDVADSNDIMFIPVGTNFDRVIEERVLIANVGTDFRGRGAGFVLGSTGQFAFKQLWRKLTGRWKGFGVAAANFGEPLSLRAWAKQNGLSFAGLDREPLFSAVEALGSELRQRIICVIPILAVPLLAMILLSSTTPMDKAALKRTALEELQRLRGLGAHAGMKPGSEEIAISEGLDLMNGLGLFVTDAQGMITANQNERELLQYHANSIIQLSDTLAAK